MGWRVAYNPHRYRVVWFFCNIESVIPGQSFAATHERVAQRSKGIVILGSSKFRRYGLRRFVCTRLVLALRRPAKISSCGCGPNRLAADPESHLRADQIRSPKESVDNGFGCMLKDAHIWKRF